MTRPPGNSLRWLTLAVLLPLLVLGVLAWLGTRAQVRAAWSSAREEAKVAVRNAEAVLSRDLAASVETTRLFPDPPVPGVASAADQVLDGNDLTSMRQLRDDPAAGISPAGLPRRVLAGFRVMEIGKDPADVRVLVSLAANEAPSVITPLVFQQAGDVAKDEAEKWSRDEWVREEFKQHPDVGSAGKWVGANAVWIAKDGDTLRYIDPIKLNKMLLNARESLPKWAELWLSSKGHVFPERPDGVELIDSLAVGFCDDLRIEILAKRPEIIVSSARLQGQWMMGVLGCAMLVSVSALVFIHRAVERERRLNAMKSDFVASVSHELRAPVASIRLMADSLSAEKIEPHTVREFHRLISREGARLSTLIENVLDFARIEQGRKSWHFEPSELAPLLTDTLGLMEPLAAEKGIALVFPEAFPAVEANVDPGAIQQALVNLLDNAIKFSPAGSRVDIHLQATYSHWEIRITDQGPGIPAAEHERIFQKFHRLGSELRRETQGTGIGLSLVKAVAEAHGGRVALASTPGQGCTFTLTGPISPIVPIPSNF